MSILIPISGLILAIFAYWFYRYNSRDNKTRILNDKQNIKDVGMYYLVLARVKNKPVAISEHSRYMHTQVIGSTGTGKTRYVFYPSIYQDIRRGAGCFILDVKSNMLPTVGSFAQYFKRNQDFYYFDIASQWSLTYNPLIGDDPNEIASRICTALYSDEERSEQFYKEIGERFISSLVRLLHTFPVQITFEELYYHITDMAKLRAKCIERPGNIDAEYFLANWTELPDLARQKQLIGLINKIGPFVTSKWSHLINTRNPDIVMDDIVANNKILLFGLSSQQYSNQYKPIAILALMHLQSVIAKRYIQAEKQGYFLYLDEFKDIVYSKFADLINKAREAKVGIMIGHQSLGDLSSISDSFENIVLTNTRNKVILSLDNVESAEYFSKLIGTHTIDEKVYSYAPEGIWNKVSGYSIKKVEEFIVHPNKFKNLKDGFAILRIKDDEGTSNFATTLHSISELPAFDPKSLKKPERQDNHNEFLATTQKTANKSAEPAADSKVSNTIREEAPSTPSLQPEKNTIVIQQKRTMKNPLKKEPKYPKNDKVNEAIKNFKRQELKSNLPKENNAIQD